MCASLALGWLVRNADRVFREGVGNRPALQDSLDLLEVLLNGLLPVLESFDVSSQLVIGSRRLRPEQRRRSRFTCLEALRFTDENMARAVDPGLFDVMLGTSSTSLTTVPLEVAGN